MNAAHKLLLRDYPLINGFQDTLLAPLYDAKRSQWQFSANKFESRTPPTTQLHYNGHHHWVASFQLKKGDPIIVLDSKYSGVSTNLQIQLAQIYGSGTNKLEVKIPVINQQKNGLDCGVYAIANCIEFCENGYKDSKKQQWVYDSNSLRKHLLDCFENNKLLTFPKTKVARPSKINVIEMYIDINCPCGYPDCMADMVGCDGKCRKWFHRSCTELLETDNPDFWYCEKCKE